MDLFLYPNYVILLHVKLPGPESSGPVEDITPKICLLWELLHTLYHIPSNSSTWLLFKAFGERKR